MPDGKRIVIPPTLLITAMGQVNDVTKCVTMDFKKAGHKIYLVGITKDELGGSHFNLIRKQQSAGVPKVDLQQSPAILQKTAEAIRHQMIAACHDLSEGGLAIALAEMCMAGGLGAIIHTSAIPTPSNEKLSRRSIAVRRKHNSFSAGSSF